MVVWPEAHAGGGQQVPRLIVADYSDNFTLYRITLKNSPNFHVSYNHGNGFTVWGLKIDTPQRLARILTASIPATDRKTSPSLTAIFAKATIMWRSKVDRAG